jgi:hypothetical protein
LAWDDHQIDIRVAKERLRRGHHLHRRPVGQHFLSSLLETAASVIPGVPLINGA